MSKTILTILCPNYNNAPYLDRAIKSILMQQVDFEYEVIFIDDCSTDNSVEIIKKYVQKYPDKIKLFQNEKNLRTLATSLKGYEMLKTPYYTVLDPDDYWIRNDYLQKAVDFLKTHPDYNIYTSNTYMKTGRKKIVLQSANTCDFSFDHLEKLVFGHTSSTVFRNTFTKKDLDKIKCFLGSSNERIYEGDTFRNFFHLSTGKGHFENVFNGVYNYNQYGIWSRLSPAEQTLLQIKFFISIFQFFDYQQAEFLLKTALYYLSKFQYQKTEDKNLIQETNQLFMTWLKYWLAYYKESKLDLSKKIYLFLPSRLIGGYEFLFIRLARKLSEIGLEVFYVDYNEDTLAHRELKNSAVRFINYVDTMSEFETQEPIHLFTPLTWSYMMPKLKNKKSKLHFLVGHPTCFVAVNIRTGICICDCSLYIDELDRKSAISYMDYACFNATQKHTKRHLNQLYTPIFLPSKEKMADTGLINKNEINLGWLGRLDEDKIYSIINTLDKFHHYQTNLKKRYHIIGQGKAKDLIDPQKYPDIEIIFTGPLVNEKMQDYLRLNVDMLVATGTSLLEGASLRIPALHCLQTETPLDEEKFIWLYDMNKYTIGFYANQYNTFKYPYTTLSQAINQILNNKEYYAKKSFEHFENNHSLDSSIPFFLRFILLGGIDNDAYENKIFLTHKKLSKIKGVKNKLRFVIYKKLNKSVLRRQNYAQKHPLLYKLWNHCSKKLKKKGIIS